MRDVVVVGAGHNGLVAACYLARAGLDVEVVERDTVVGGAVSTVERFPGYRMDRGSSAHIMVRHTGIVEDLRLAECGLVYQDLDPWGFAPFGPADDQQAITFWADVDRTCASIEAVCGTRDADAYARFVEDWGARNERIFAAFASAPTGRSLGRSLWGVGKGTGLSGTGAVATVPAAGGRAARHDVRRRAAEDGTGLAGRAVRAADARGRHR